MIACGGQGISIGLLQPGVQRGDTSQRKAMARVVKADVNLNAGSRDAGGEGCFRNRSR